MAVLMQSPLAFNSQLFAQLTLNNFITPVFRTLFQAFVAAGGLPTSNVSQGLWLHIITKAAGPMLEGVINELSVMPLPLSLSKGLSSASSLNSSAAYDYSGESAKGGPSDLLRVPSEEEQKYANELLIKLLDVGFMRKIGAIKLRMSKLEDGSEKLNLLGQITRLESARKDLQSQIL